MAEMSIGRLSYHVKQTLSSNYVITNSTPYSTFLVSLHAGYPEQLQNSFPELIPFLAMGRRTALHANSLPTRYSTSYAAVSGLSVVFPHRSVNRWILLLTSAWKGSGIFGSGAGPVVSPLPATLSGRWPQACFSSRLSPGIRAHRCRRNCG